MPIRDAERRRTADRERKRARRHAGLAAVVELAGDGADAGADTGGNQTVHSGGLPDLATVAGIRACLARALGRLERAKLDAIGSARATGSLATAAIRLLETGELEERLAALESKIETEGQANG